MSDPNHRSLPPRSLAARIAAAVLLVFLGYASPSPAFDFDTGHAADLAGDHERAFEVWNALALQGVAEAQFGLGTLYFEGAGVPRDLAESTRWFQRAAEQGYAPAQFNLGNAYKDGRGVERDDKRAAHWWHEAAVQDFAPAQFNLGSHYYFGRGVPRDEQRALEWYRRAADNGHPVARQMFGLTPTDPEATGAAGGEVPGQERAPAGILPPGDKLPGVPVPPASAPAPPAAGEDWILAQDPDAYTLQLLAMRDEASLLAYLERHRFADRVAYFRFQRDGVDWYAVVHGAYPGPSAAKAASDRMPEALRESRPWVRRFDGIQRLIRGR